MDETEERAKRVERLTDQIGSLGDIDLARLEAWLVAETGGVDQSGARSGVTRRQVLGGAVVGAASLVLGGLGGGALGAAWGDVQGAERVRVASEQEIQKLKGLIQLYEALEAIGIDAVVATAIGGLELTIKGLKDGVLSLRQAVEMADSLLQKVELSMPSLRAGLSVAEGFVSLLGGQLKLMQSALYEVTGKLSPVSDALGAFLSDLIAKIPLGVGDRILEANRRIGQLVGGLPEALEGINQQLLVPLRAGWLSDDESMNLNGRLLAPLRKSLLQPLLKHLDDLAGFLTDVENKLFAPAKSAISERAKVRDQIARYRAALGMA